MSTPLSQLAYEHIQQKLLSDSFHTGTRISETKLARELGISRTPVREAIRRLQSEGLLYQVPSSGTFLAQPDRSQLIEAYEVREALECMAVVKATKRMTSQERNELKSLSEKMHAAATAMRDAKAEVLDGEPLRQFLTADLAFHLLLLRAAGNQLAMKIVADSHVRNRVFGYRSHCRGLHHVAWVWLIHARIARAVLRRDPQAARYWMRRHIRTSLRDALAAFDEQMAHRTRAVASPAALTQALEELASRLIGEQVNPASPGSHSKR